MNPFWPTIGVVVFGLAFMFHTEVSEAIGRINSVGPDGVTLIQRAKEVNINIGAPPSLQQLQEAKEKIAKHAKEMLGVHPVTFAYVIRSATCSLWNKTEIEKTDQLKYLMEIRQVGLGELFVVRNKDTAEKLGGEGLQVVLNDQARFMLMTFEVTAEPCVPPKSATPIQ
jgi:hypothetical protein